MASNKREAQIVYTVLLQMRANGCSFEDISNELREKYNIKRSRQALHSKYNRIRNQGVTNFIGKDDEKVNAFVIKAAARGIPLTAIASNLENIIGESRTYYYIREIAGANEEAISKYRHDIVHRVAVLLSKGESIESIMGTLEVGGLKPSSTAKDRMIAEAVQVVITKRIKEIAKNMTALCGDSRIVDEALETVVSDKLYKG